jgi:hypothetical protein
MQLNGIHQAISWLLSFEAHQCCRGREAVLKIRRGRWRRSAVAPLRGRKLHANHDLLVAELVISFRNSIAVGVVSVCSSEFVFIRCREEWMRSLERR